MYLDRLDLSSPSGGRSVRAIIAPAGRRLAFAGDDQVAAAIAAADPNQEPLKAMIVFSEQALLDLATRLVANMDTGAVGLFVNNHVPTEADDALDYTEPTEAWYAQKGHGLQDQQATWDATTKRAVVRGAICIWDRGNAPGSLTVYGYFVFDDNRFPFYAERFSTPVVLNQDNPILAFRVRYQVWNAPTA